MQTSNKSPGRLLLNLEDHLVSSGTYLSFRISSVVVSAHACRSMRRLDTYPMKHRPLNTDKCHNQSINLAVPIPNLISAQGTVHHKKPRAGQGPPALSPALSPRRGATHALVSSQSGLH